MKFQYILSFCFFSLLACGEAQQETTEENNTSKDDGASQGAVEDSDATQTTGSDFQGLADTKDLFDSYYNVINPPKPNLKQVDHSGLGNCYTKAQQKAHPNFCSKLREEKRDSEKENKNSVKSYRSFANKHLIIDYDWKETKGFLRVDKFGCWNEGLSVWNPAKKESDCTDGTWTLRSYKYSKSSKGYKYSATSTPEKPDLMKRINAKEVNFPDEIFCEVQELEKSGKGSKVSCQVCKPEKDSKSCEDYTVKATNGVRTDINLGDIISVPFAKAPKEGILLEQKNKHFVVHADSNALKVVKANNSCPTQEELNPHICRFATTSYEPKEVFTACSAAGNVAKIATLAKRWDKNKKIEDKSNFMIDVLKSVTSKDAGNLWAQLALAQNQVDAGKTSDAIVTIKSFVSKVDDKKELSKAVKIATKLEDESVAMSIYQKLCDAGDKGACKKLPQPETE